VDVIVYGIVPVIENIEIATGKKHIVLMDAADGCWTPDGKTFVAVTQPEVGKTMGRIATIDISTGDERIIAESGASPCITPDGSTVIYTDGMSLLCVPLASGDPEQLPVEGQLWNPRCSPDGVWILGTGNTNGDTSRTWLRAYNRQTNKTVDVLASPTHTLEMGAWSADGKQYCYTKTSLSGGSGSSIWIADFDSETIGNSTSTEVSVPSQFKLIGNYPNPFNPSTTIEFSLSASGKASLAVYNMSGQKVRELVAGQLSAGKHSVIWNGRDDRGKPVSSGVYITRLKMEGKVESHRMTLVK
jgi:Tol biopolymer transport system component